MASTGVTAVSTASWSRTAISVMAERRYRADFARLSAVPNRRPQLELIAPGASPEEAAAIVAALERFMRETAPAPAADGPPRNPWQRAALLEGVGREPEGVSP